MESIYRDREEKGIQLTLFQYHSIESHEEIKPKKSRQREIILSKLKLSKQNGMTLRIFPQYGARIYELRRMGHCIRSARVEGEKGKYFVYNPNGHYYSNEIECSVCGTPKVRE